MTDQIEIDVRYRQRLIAGSIAVALLVVTAFAFGLWRIQALQHGLNELVDEHYRQSKLAADMRMFARDRLADLILVTHSDDVFERDEALQRFYELGGRFRAARRGLLAANLDGQERSLLARIDVLTASTLLAQDELLEMVQAGRSADAEMQFVKRVVPRQAKVMQALAELSQLQDRHVAAASAAAKRHHAEAMWAAGASGLVALVLSGFIVMTMIRRTTGLVANLQDSREQLQDALTTLEWEKAAVDAHNLVSIADAEGRITYANDKFVQVSGYSREELLGSDHHIVNSGFHPPAFWWDFWHTISEGRVWTGLVRNRAKNGAIYWVQSTVVPLLDASGLPFRYMSIRTEVTDRKRAEESVEATNRSLRMLSGCDEALLRATNEQDLLRDICELIVNIGGYRMAWVGYVMQDESKAVTPVGVAGISAGYLDGAAVCWAETERGNGPIGRAIRSGEAVIVADATTDPGFEPWRAEALKRGYSAVIALPLKVGERVIGALAIYAGREACFDTGETALLKELAADLSYGIQTLRTRVERERVGEQLVLAKEAAESASHAKSDFLSRMSHELRTPLHWVLGYAQLLDSDTTEPLSAVQRESLQHIRDAGRRLLEMIGEIIDFTGLESGSLQARLERVSFAAIARKSVEMTMPVAEVRRIRLQLGSGFEPDADEMMVRADAERLRQVVVNLLSNAVKFNQPGGLVRLDLGEGAGPERVRLSVTDSGAGLTPDQQRQLFSPFARLDANEREIDGMGVGLALGKRLMMLMGGEIGVESVVGRGSTFWVELPRDGVSVDPDPVHELMR